MAGVPYTFGSATTSIPLSQLDSNFTTPVTIGTTTVALGNTTTTLAGLTSVATNTLTSAAATALTLQSAGSTAITVDTSQNVGIGTSSPSYKLDILTAGGGVYAAQFGNGTAAQGMRIVTGQDSTSSGITTAGGTRLIQFDGTNNNTLFYTNATERMRIDSNGRVLIAATATSAYFDGNLNIAQTSGSGVTLTTKQSGGTASQASVVNWHTATSGDNQFIQFVTETSPTVRGSISYNRAGGLTAYNVTSDYRSKTVNGPVQNALAKLALLKPSTGRMNDASIDIDFFVAHELQEVVPSAVSGEKDAVNEDNTPKYQMVDKSAVIPLLTAAIQEQQALITALTARITALETK